MIPIKTNGIVKKLVSYANFRTIRPSSGTDSYNGELKKLTDFGVRIVRDCPDMPSDAGNAYYLLLNLVALSDNYHKSAIAQILIPYTAAGVAIYVRNGRLDFEGTDRESYYQFYNWRKVSLSELGGGQLNPLLLSGGAWYA